jgi:hypothetical protein
LQNILSGLPNLRELELIQPILSLQSAQAVASRISWWHLEKLVIVKPIPEMIPRIWPPEINLLWQILREAVRSSQTIQKLEIRGIAGGFEGWEDIFARLSVLSVCEGAMYAADLTRVTQTLENNVTLTSLSLQGCYFYFKPFLPQLMSALSTSRSSLQTLDLSRICAIGYEGLRTISAIIQVLPHLTTVFLSRCASLSFTGHEIFAEHALRRAHELTLQKQAAQALAHAVQQNRSIQNMDVSENDFTEEHLKEIDFHLTVNRIRPYLILSNQNGLNSTIWCYILAKQIRQAKTSTTSLIFYSLSEQPNLIQPCQRPARKRSRYET